MGSPVLKPVHGDLACSEGGWWAISSSPQKQSWRAGDRVVTYMSTMTFNKVMCAKQNNWEIPDRKGGRIWGRPRSSEAFHIM